MSKEDERKVHIIGAGPAGLACGIILSQNGMNCTIYEKEEWLGNKICGEGITWTGVCALEKMGITEKELRKRGAHPVEKSLHIFPYFSKVIDHRREKYYTLSRKKLLLILADKYQLYGGELVMGHQVRNIREFISEDSICVNAAGCMIQPGKKHLSEKLPVGIAAVISGETTLSDRIMYFLHREDLTDRYAWCFPMGNREWNIGIWQTGYAENILGNFQRFYDVLTVRYFSNIDVKKRAQGACLGVYPTTREEEYKNYYVCGDAAGTCDFMSGEGISQALISGCYTAMAILQPSDDSLGAGF